MSDRFYNYGMDEAIIQAKYSTCLSTHYGTAILDPNTGHVIATGRNGVPKGKEHCTDRGWCVKRELGYDHFQQDMKEWAGISYCVCSHAEKNAIAQAGIRANNCIMFLYGERNGEPITCQPCFDCTKLIINAGITSVIIRPATKFIEIDPLSLYDYYENVLLNKISEYNGD